MSDLYWVGSRESDISSTGELFAGSITLYGDGKDCLSQSVRVDNNGVSAARDEFVLESVKRTAEQNPNARFCFYDPSWVYDIKGLVEYADRIICKNSAEIYKTVNDKIAFTSGLPDNIRKLYRNVISASDISYSACRKMFGVTNGKAARFIVQAPVASGGAGTYLLSSKNAKRVCKKLAGGDRYLVSVYEKNNIPVNIHAVVTDGEPVILPGSVQILREESDRLIYRGADYAAYRMISDDLRAQAERIATDVANHVKSLGYRGVCGMDVIIVGDTAYFVEFNGRFQGSTATLDIALKESGLPCVAQLNISAFNGEEICERQKLHDVKVDYSSYAYLKSGTELFGNYILENAHSEPLIARVDRDGYEPEQGEKIDELIYMFRVVIKGNITSVNEDGGIFVHEHIAEPSMSLYKKTVAKDLLAVKITLMTLGVKILPRAEKHLLENGGIRPGNNNAVDMNVLGMVVNAPRDIKFIALSPYTVDVDENGKLELYYYGKFMIGIGLYPLDPLGIKTTSRGVPYETVAYLSTDRLRVHMTNECIFKRQNIGCRFCNIVPCKDPISLDDVREVVNDYVANSPAVEHFLVGGQSMEQVQGLKTIAEMIRIIRNVTDKRVYVMALPYDEQTVKNLVDAGMNELACNIEIFDPVLALKYMPGKGRIKREVYYRVLSYARTLLPEPGAVRAMLIVGLEPHKSFIAGIKKLAKLGIQPIISIFRPLPDTPLENLIAPPLDYVYDLYYQAEKICNKYGLRLGPACVYCQNNTLSLPDRLLDNLK